MATTVEQQELVPPLSPIELAGGKKQLTVCVTGATGFVAGWVVRRLLAAGHTVRGTCRDPNATKAVAHLLDMPGARERLALFKADLLAAGAFDEAVAGCDVVIHTASPYQLDVPKGKEEELMIKPAIFGTRNVLDSVNRTPSVTRVVVTASTVSVWSDPHERGKGHVFTEDDWNLTANPREFPYFYAKTQAERAAYEMAEQAKGRWTLVSLNPGAIWGPPTGARTDGESVGQVVDLLAGALWPWAPPLGVGTVDVRDVALAHCAAAVAPQAQGRYLLNSEPAFVMTTAAKVLRKAYPARWLPPLKPPLWSLVVFGPIMGLPVPITKATYRKLPKVSTAKAARDLGLAEYIPLKRSILEMAADVLRKGMVPRFKLPVAWPVLAVDVLLIVLVLRWLALLAVKLAGF